MLQRKNTEYQLNVKGLSCAIIVYLQEDLQRPASNTDDVDSKDSEHDDIDIANEIKVASEKYVEDYWSERSRESDADENADENTAFDDLLKELKKKDKREIEKVLNKVAKQNMSTYYNMLLPKAVLRSHFSLIY